MAVAIPLPELNALDEAAFVARLANVFEHSPWIAARAAGRRPFAGIGALFAALTAVLETAQPEQRLALIRAHPDLATRFQRADALTAESITEQNSAGLDRLSDREYRAFAEANDRYREKFGFPYVACVRRHTRDSIIRNFAQRLTHDFATEIEVSITEICRIAALRLAGLVAADDTLPVHGHLSTHVLDAHAGLPAAGVAVELVELSALGGDRTIIRAVTNCEGRTEEPLIHGRPVPIGQYELRFATGAYFSARRVPMTDPPFFDIVAVRFAVAEPEGHLHVPLLVTPWGYTTYRGS